MLCFFHQVFALSKLGQLRREESCAEVQDTVSAEGPVKMVGCQLDPPEDHKWTLSEVIHHLGRQKLFNLLSFCFYLICRMVKLFTS